MKIVRVQPVVIKIAQGDSFGGHGRNRGSTSGYFIQPGWRGLYSDRTETTLVRIETDEGIVGYGEGQSPVGPEITAAVIDRLLGPLLVGRDPSHPQALQHEMYQMMNVRGHFTECTLHAISAVDIALWY